MIQEIEENDEQPQIVVYLPEGSDIEVEQRMKCCLTKFQERSGLDTGRTDILECAIRWAVEQKRRERATERKQAEEQEQGKKVRLIEQEDQPEEMPAQSTEAGRRAVRGGRGCAGLVQGRDERH